MTTKEEEMTAAAGARTSRLGAVLAVLLLAIVALALGLAIRAGFASRVLAQNELKRSADQSLVMAVNVGYPKQGAPVQEIVLPGSVQAYTDTPIYARTSGYLKRWYFDIGARVKQGDLLFELETPELHQQLLQSRSELETAQTNLRLAESTAERWQHLLQTDSVSRQETDEKLSDVRAKKSVVESLRSNVKRIEELLSFQKVYAPFDGVITMRNTDTGALVDAGANASNKALFRLSAMNKLRVFVAVPEIYSRATRPGVQASLTLDEFPGRSFAGTLVRSMNAIDPAAHTLTVEFEVDNPKGELLPGAYVSVHLKLPGQAHSVVIPSNTLLFRAEGPSVGIVRNGKAQLTAVRIGRDYGNTVEIVSGLQVTDAVILDPTDSLTNGTPIHVQNAAGGSGGAAK